MVYREVGGRVAPQGGVGRGSNVFFWIYRVGLRKNYCISI